MLSIVCRSIAVASLCVSVAAAAYAQAPGRLAAERLRADALVNPLQSPSARPTLSWVCAGRGYNLGQSAYRVIASSSREKAEAGEGDLWDTGRVVSSDSLHIRYAGRALRPGQRAYWRVQLWDADGETGEWSEIATFGGPLADNAWPDSMWIGLDALPGDDEAADLALGFGDARWIAHPDDARDQRAGVSVLGTRFSVPRSSAVQKATLIITADDEFQCRLNGHDIGSGDNWEQAQVFDVTDQIAAGDNCLRVHLRNTSDGPMGLLSRLHIRLENGREIDVVTGDRWFATKTERDWQRADLGNTRSRELARYGGGPWGGRVNLPAGAATKPSRYLRHDFEVPQSIERATLYLSCLGFADAYVNGERVSGRFVSDWTDYNKRVYSYAYDVTDKLRQGGNAIGMVLSDGWFAGWVSWSGREHWGVNPRVAAQLHIEYEGGRSEVVRTGMSWRAMTGPVRRSDMLMGEVYDNTITRTDGFSEPGFDDSDWLRVSAGLDEVHPVVEPTPCVPIDAFHEFAPVAVTEPSPGVYLLDMGRNFAGVVRLRITGERGQRIVIRHGERLNPDGSLYTDNLRRALATDEYICRGNGEEVFEPRFTFHGFQYVEVSGLTEPPKQGTITGVAIGSLTPQIGSFECSNPMLNQLASNVYWTQRANFISVPTDCPQRDERLGWTGDAQVYVRTAGLWCDVQAFFDKWLIDLTDATPPDGNAPKVAPVLNGLGDGGPAWADAATICPWAVYNMYDDPALIERQYPAMKAWVDFQARRSTRDRRPPSDYHAYGDWLDVQAPTPKDVIYMAYWAQSTRLVVQAARLLGKDSDAADYDRLLSEIIASFNKNYIDSDGRVRGDSQTGYVLALRYGLVDGERFDQAAAHLVRKIEERGWHLSTGFIGTKDLMLVLAEIGRNDIAYRLITNEDYPSWGFSIRHGATSIWERWDGWTPENGFQNVGMNSFAHYSFGAVYQWMVEQIGGIQLVEPGYKTFRIAPVPGGGLTHATVGIDSVRGPIRSHWELIDGGRIRMTVTIPANTACSVVVPTDRPESIVVTEGADAAAEGLARRTGAVLELGSGTYTIEAAH